jgi:hypothetical protein
VARGLGAIGSDRNHLAHQVVQERRLAGIGAADDGDMAATEIGFDGHTR